MSDSFQVTLARLAATFAEQVFAAIHEAAVVDLLGTSRGRAAPPAHHAEAQPARRPRAAKAAAPPRAPPAPPVVVAAPKPERAKRGRRASEDVAPSGDAMITDPEKLLTSISGLGNAEGRTTSRSTPTARESVPPPPPVAEVRAAVVLRKDESVLRSTAGGVVIRRARG